MLARGRIGFLARACFGIFCAAAFTGYVLYEILERNRVRSCVVQDTPYLGLCPEVASESFRVRAAALQARIAAGPGDARAYAELAYLVSGESGQGQTSGMKGEAVLQSAVLVAPNDRDVLRMQAGLAISKQDWGKAVRLLVQLADQHVDYSSASVLGRLVAQGVGSDLLMPYVSTGSAWLPRMMETMAQSGLPASSALPLVMKGYSERVLTPAMLQPIIKNMKGAGHWADAYALWVYQHGGKPVDLVYNANFERPFRNNGFDWEIAATGSGRAGAEVQRVRFPERGFAMSVQYSGRVIAAPPVRQQLFLYGGKYRMRLQYMTDKLRSEDGLAWILACESPKAVFARSPPIGNTATEWRQLVFEFEVPSNCTSVVNLQLETYSAFEATVGFTGRAYFDSIHLERLGQPAAVIPKG